MKRVIDIVFSLLAFVVLAPVLIVVTIILRFTGEREIIFVQERIGQGGKIFKLLKFVTMAKGSSTKGTGMISVRNDPRVSRFGRILRRTKINELPQLLNIIKGDMSVIGPRPLPKEHYDYYSDEVKEAIGGIRPGLSGIGSIVFRDEEIIMGNIKLPCDVCYQRHIAPYKGLLETWYSVNQCTLLDLKLICITLLVVLRPGVDVHNYIRGLPPRPEAINHGGNFEEVGFKSGTCQAEVEAIGERGIT